MSERAIAAKSKAPAPLGPGRSNTLQRQCACGTHTAAGGECAECSKKKFSLQRKLMVGARHDPLELEADRVADQVMAAPPHSRLSGLAPRIQRLSGQPNGQIDTAPASVDQVLAGPGRSLEPALRQYMEQRFGHDFSGVRIHTGTVAEQSANEVNANAYTVGHDNVFGAGCLAPGTNDGRRLTAHELAHVVQQSGFSDASLSMQFAAPRPADRPTRGDLGVTALLIQRDGPVAGTPSVGGHGSVPQLAPTESFDQMWARFERLRYGGHEREALDLAPALVGSMMLQDAMRHAGELAHWLLQQGQFDLASRAISNLESAWWVHYVTDQVPAATLLRAHAAFGGLYGPLDLMEDAEAQAAANRDDKARDMFGLAFLMLQMQYLAFSDQRLRDLLELSQSHPLPTRPGSEALDFPFIRLLSYSQVGQIVSDMRRILSYYSVREREATAQGRSADAARYADLGRRLRQRLREHYLLTGTAEAERGLTMEATYGVHRRRGPGYTLHGVRGREEFVTPLPGEPLPDELGSHPSYTTPMEEVFEHIAGQEDLLTELLSHPEIRKHFRGRRIDMNDLSMRLTIWHEMFAVFKRQPTPGCANALCSLLRLIERYLRHFTVHTGYNIRDFGASYIGLQFPEDLLGRVVRDCGVYAVTVAYEVYRTVHTASPRVPVHLQLVNTLEHFMLVIHDDATHEHYVVSNDRIIGPNTGDPIGTVASTYAGVMGHPFGISAAGRGVSLGTGISDVAFRRQLWQSYETGARLALEPGSRQPGDTRPQGEREQAAYRGYYDAMTHFDQAAQAGFRRLQEVTTAFARDPAGRDRTLAAALPELDRAGTAMASIIDAIVRSPHIGLRPGPNLPMQREALLTTPTGIGVHPLARIGKALLFAERHGHTLTAAETALLAWLHQAPFPSLRNELVRYDAAGRPPQF